MKLSRTLLALAATTVLAAGAYMALPSSTPVNLESDLPPGALLTIESPNFAALLASWNTSPEQTAWLKSANYSAFTNSRLFSRLGDAQTEFENAGNTAFGPDFLHQVAGKESIFAWYDIAKLEFVYITHLPPGRAATLDLLKQRPSFSRREASGIPFFVKTVQPGGENGPTQPRTIAFATAGDYLILGTREDLVASTLALIAKPQPADSMAGEAWYTAAESAAQGKHGDLHMLLDLQRIAATPAFRTYWIQQNVTQTKSYRSAVVDLYRESSQFREERTLLPASPPESAPVDLGRLESLAPSRTGVYRATALPSAQDALATIEEKVLLRNQTSSATSTAAPTADLTTPDPGSSVDLETRIDTPILKPESAATIDVPLLSQLSQAGLEGIMTLDRTGDATGPFVPIHSAVVLQARHPWNVPALQSAILASLRARLTVDTRSLAWTGSSNRFTLGDAHPIQLFVDNNTAILTDDPAFLDDILQQRTTAPHTQSATLIAAFHHTQERRPYLQLTSALAFTSSPTKPDDDTPTEGKNPDFLHNTVGSLSTSFQSLDTERIVEHIDGAVIRQTVTYRWRK